MLKVYMFHYVTEGFNYYHFDIKQFEKIVKELETGEVPLDEAINKYTEAMKLAKECSDKLNKVTEKVNKIMLENGKLDDFTVSE